MRLSWLVVVVALALAGCDGGVGADVDAGISDVADVTGVGDVFVDTIDDVPADEFEMAVTVFTQAYQGGMAGIATGEFGEFSVEYDPIEIDAKYAHILTFNVSPLLPPKMSAQPANGPLILYSDDMDVIVFSPMDHFFESLVDYRDGGIHYGFEGELDAVYGGTEHRFLAVEGHGINQAINAWGRALLDDRGKVPVDRYADVGLSYLGYWTDNGAAYYYATEAGMNEEDTLLAVRDDCVQRGIPIGYVQLDSWWYFKERTGMINPGGLVEWTPRVEMFPSGLTAFQTALGLPLIAHNRWFAKENTYRDDFDFVEGDEMALPTERGPFDRFMEDLKAWGGVTYEQDWLVSQYLGLDHFRTDMGFGARYMNFLDSAATSAGLTIQLCMAGGAHLMDSVDRASVTTIRTSIDYSRNVCKECFWPQFHTVNLLAAAVGLWPFKDNFWVSEDFGSAEALVSILSAGMVGIGDPVGTADPDVIARVCRLDGLLLKPDRTATPIDAMFLPHARPYWTSTESAVTGVGRWVYAAGYHLASQEPARRDEDQLFSLFAYDGEEVGDMFVYPDKVTDWGVDPVGDFGVELPAVAWDWKSRTGKVVDGAFDVEPLVNQYDFKYLVFAPVLANGLALIGETGKYVTMADRRMADVRVDGDGIEVDMVGVPGEQVTLQAYDATAGAALESLTVTVGQNGQVTAVIAR